LGPFLKRNILFGLGVLAVLGVGVMFFNTHWGPGIGGDSTIYLTSAKDLISGRGLGLINADGNFRLIPYFPPFFPLILAFFGLLNLDMVTAAQWMNNLLFGGIIWLSGFVIYRSLNSAVYAFLASFLVFASPALIPVFSWVMSEPLSMFLGFLSLALLIQYFVQPNKLIILILSSALVGLSLLTRYTSVSYLGTGLIGIILFLDKSIRDRLKDCLTYLFVGIIPMIIWVAIDLNQTATVSSRSLESGTGMVNRIMSLFPSFRQSLLFWLVPDSWVYSPKYPVEINQFLPVAALILFLIWFGIVFGKYVKIKKGDRGNHFRLWVLLGIFCVIYFSVIVLVNILTYPPITINSRMISPVYVAVLWLTIILAYNTEKNWARHRWLKVLMPVGISLVIVWYGWASFNITRQNYKQGLGFLSLEWQLSPTIQAIKALPTETILITNQEMAVLFLTGRVSYPFREAYQTIPSETFSSYGDGDLENDKPQYLFREKGAALVLFDTLYDDLAGLYGERTRERVTHLIEGLIISFKGNDGAIYFYPSP